MFWMVALLITHSAIDFISFELDLTKNWVEEISLGISENKAPMGEGCILDCILPTRYKLPCRCWLYLCITLDVPLPISLIHPRWFFDGPAKVAPAWIMSFNLDTTLEDMKEKAQYSTQEVQLEYDTDDSLGNREI